MCELREVRYEGCPHTGRTQVRECEYKRRHGLKSPRECRYWTGRTIPVPYTGKCTRCIDPPPYGNTPNVPERMGPGTVQPRTPNSPVSSSIWMILNKDENGNGLPQREIDEFNDNAAPGESARDYFQQKHLVAQEREFERKHGFPLPDYGRSWAQGTSTTSQASSQASVNEMDKEWDKLGDRKKEFKYVHEGETLSDCFRRELKENTSKLFLSNKRQHRDGSRTPTREGSRTPTR